MTTRVTGAGSARKWRYTVAFYLPEGLKAPKPNDSGIKIVQYPKGESYVR